MLLAHLLAVLVLAASPRLHHRVHPDADDDDHDCAVVWFLHGGADAAPAPTAVPAFVRVEVAERVVALRRAAFVPSVFAGNRVFEHGPPQAWSIFHRRRFP